MGISEVELAQMVIESALLLQLASSQVSLEYMKYMEYIGWEPKMTLKRRNWVTVVSTELPPQIVVTMHSHIKGEPNLQ